MPEIDTERRLAALERRIAVLEATAPEKVFTATVTTTDATATTIYSFSTSSNSVMLMDVKVIALRTDVYGETAAYRYFIKIENIGGGVVAALLQDAALDDSAFIREDNAAWAVPTSISGTNFLVRVTGVAGNTINWYMRATIIGSV